jgi:hypothetical protein
MFTNQRLFLLPYFVLLPIAFYLFGFHIDSADFIQYTSLSEAYAHLPVTQAANNFWSPLLSWLLIPFNFFLNDHLLSFKILQSILILLSYLQLIRLSSHYLGNFKIRFYFLFFSLLVLFDYGFLSGSPDLLYLTLLLFILTILHNENLRIKDFVVLGILGALLYYAKNFGFVFFSVLCVFMLLSRKKSAIAKPGMIFISLGIFLALCAPWICFISANTGYFLISGASEYNFRILGPQMNPDMFGDIMHPISFPHLQAPPNEFAVSAWQQPLGMRVPVRDFNFAYHFKLVARNYISVGYYYLSLNNGLLLGLLALFSFFRFKNNPVKIFTRAFLPLAFALITTVLYCFILTQQRYLIINEIVLLLLIGLLLENSPTNWKNKLLIFAFLSSSFFAFKTFKRDFDPAGAVNWKKNELVNYLRESDETKRLVSELKDGADGYTLACILGSFSNAQNYGMIKMQDFGKINSELKKHQVTYLLASGNNTIKSKDKPLCTFLAYSPELNYSLYRIN